MCSSAAITVVNGALLYGLSGTCCLNGINAQAYTDASFARNGLSANRVDELLPWNVALTNK